MSQVLANTECQWRRMAGIIARLPGLSFFLHQQTWEKSHGIYSWWRDLPLPGSSGVAEWTSGAGRCCCPCGGREVCPRDLDLDPDLPRQTHSLAARPASAAPPSRCLTGDPCRLDSAPLRSKEPVARQGYWKLSPLTHNTIKYKDKQPGTFVFTEWTTLDAQSCKVWFKFLQ